MAYRGSDLPLPRNDPERLAALEAQKDRGLGVYDDLKKWRNGIPDEDRPEAEAAWEADLRKLKADRGASSELAERFFIRTLQLSNDAANDVERRSLLERALEGQQVARFAASHRSSLAVAAAREGDFVAVARWLGECDPDPDDILADGAYRVGRGFVALQQGDAESALRCLGESRQQVTFPVAYRSLASFYRAQALRLAGRERDAEEEIRAIVARIGVTGAESYVDKLPPAWRFRSRALYGPVLASKSFDASFKLVAAIFWGLVGVGAVVVLSQADPPFAADQDTMGLWIAVPLLFAVAGFQLLRARRLRRIVDEGCVASGRVTGKVRTAWKTGTSGNLYRLYVEAEAPGTGQRVAGQSYELFGWRKTDELQGAKIWVLWHPEQSGRASVVPRDEPNIR